MFTIGIRGSVIGCDFVVTMLIRGHMRRLPSRPPPCVLLGCDLPLQTPMKRTHNRHRWFRVARLVSPTQHMMQLVVVMMHMDGDAHDDADGGAY